MGFAANNINYRSLQSTEKKTIIVVSHVKNFRKVLILGDFTLFY